MKEVRVKMSNEEHEILVKDAAEQHISLSQLIRMRATANTEGIEEDSSKIAKLLPWFFLLCNQVRDPDLRKQFNQVGQAISACLYPEQR